MWGGFAGILVAVFAVIIIFLTRKNILDVLERDVILYDKNFELKKIAIERSLLLVDQIANSDNNVKSDKEFIEKARASYNELLCVADNIRLPEYFQGIALDINKNVLSTEIAEYKIMCRRELGLGMKGSVKLKSSANAKLNKTESTFTHKEPIKTIQPNIKSDELQNSKPVTFNPTPVPNVQSATPNNQINTNNTSMSPAQRPVESTLIPKENTTAIQQSQSVETVTRPNIQTATRQPEVHTTPTTNVPTQTNLESATPTAKRRGRPRKS